MLMHCVKCKKTVRKRQQGLKCIKCNRGYHRTCEGRMHISEYLRRYRRDQIMEWSCVECIDVCEDVTSVPRGNNILSNDRQVTINNTMDIDEPEAVVETVSPGTNVEGALVFNIAKPFEPHTDILEDSVQMDLECIPEVEQPKFEIVRGGTEKGGDLLICKDYYTYTQHSKARPYQWECSKKRSKACKATVREKTG